MQFCYEVEKLNENKGMHLNSGTVDSQINTEIKKGNHSYSGAFLFFNALHQNKSGDQSAPLRPGDRKRLLIDGAVKKTKTRLDFETRSLNIQKKCTLVWRTAARVFELAGQAFTSTLKMG